MRQKLSNAIALTILMSLGIAVPAHAVSLTSDQTSDVGDLVGTAGTTNTQPSGTPLTSIEGVLDSEDKDLYQIRLPGGTFTASTVGGTNLNTQLFLFDANGFGITANNDADISTYQSTISQAISNAGNYYLGISSEGFNPQSAGGSIFTIDPITDGVEDPLTGGAGSGSPLNSWSTGFAAGGEDYTIALSGAQFTGSSAAVPFDFNPIFGLVTLGIWVGWARLRRGWEELKKRQF